MTIVPAVPAATVLIVRDSARGIEVLMTERPSRGTFAGAWVFPGGRVEPSDAGDDAQERARSAAVRETFEETGLVIEPDTLVPLVAWEPPENLPARFSTWFFAAPDPGGDIVLQEAEAVRAEWVSPADALERHSLGDMSLVPPTYVMLHGLLTHETTGTLLAMTALAEQLVTRILRRGVLVWPGDEEWDSESPGPFGARHRLTISELPWHFERTSSHDQAAPRQDAGPDPHQP